MDTVHQKGAFSVFGQTGRDTGVCRCALWAMAFCLLTVFLSGCTAPAANSTVLDAAQTAETPAQQDGPELTEAQAEYVTLFTGDGYTEPQALDIYRYAEELGFTRSTAQKLVAYEAQTEDERLAQAAALFQKQGFSAAGDNSHCCLHFLRGLCGGFYGQQILIPCGAGIAQGA